MARSTAKFISYDLRPSKQTERRILLDLMKIAGDCGLPISSYRYIGMGANRFYDFLLIHKYLGIQKMISLEHDDEMYKRALFNVPYGFIDVKNSDAASFIATDALSDPCLLWLDYDGGIGSRTVSDISSLSTKLKVGDFCFVTVFGGPPRVLDRENDETRLVWLQDNLGDVAGEVTMADVERSAFPDAVHKVLIAAFRNAFSVRRDGGFVPFLQVEYSDSLPMVTVGGGFLADGQASSFKTRVSRALPFLSTEATKLYEIRSMHLTERERVLFDKAATKKNKVSSEKNQLKALGFKEHEISTYRDLIRYLPRYVETIV
ncbi:O-methyltransferase [Inquilinus sp. YAF38]|uniref:O-methyltransferase n=1 Tax=Inquilinus sp. YAF38 TaxID=3233084 RepID=UPI003F924A8A